MLCDACFLEHNIEDCRALYHLQILQANGVVTHKKFAYGGKGRPTVVGGEYCVFGLYRSGQYLHTTNAYSGPFCAIKFLQFCHSYAYANEAFKDIYEDTYIGARENYCLEWMLSRMPHLALCTPDGTPVIEKLFASTHKGSVRKKVYDYRLYFP